jgi:hypothetical protein
MDVIHSCKFYVEMQVKYLTDHPVQCYKGSKKALVTTNQASSYPFNIQRTFM